MDSATATARQPAQATSPASLVDPRGVRFGQTLTATGLLAGVAFGRPEPIYFVGLVLVTAVVSGWRVDAWATVYRSVVAPRLGPPDEREPAAPHRFAKLLGASGSGLASVLYLVGLEFPAFVVAALVAGAAGLAAVTGFCLGCRLYRGVSFVRRVGVV